MADPAVYFSVAATHEGLKPQLFVCASLAGVYGFSYRFYTDSLNALMELCEWDEKQFMASGYALEMKAEATRKLVEKIKSIAFTEVEAELLIHNLIQAHASADQVVEVA